MRCFGLLRAQVSVQLGDASIASPFTHKGSTIRCVLHILRCALRKETREKLLASNQGRGRSIARGVLEIRHLTCNCLHTAYGQPAAWATHSARQSFRRAPRSSRSTLATVMQMYKIMAITSLVSAFSMSVLTLDGVKLGDTQAAAETLFSTVIFFTVARPLSVAKQKLTVAQPCHSVFQWPILTSLLFQVAALFSP